MRFRLLFIAILLLPSLASAQTRVGPTGNPAAHTSYYTETCTNGGAQADYLETAGADNPLNVTFSRGAQDGSCVIFLEETGTGYNGWAIQLTAPIPSGKIVYFVAKFAEESAEFTDHTWSVRYGSIDGPVIVGNFTVTGESFVAHNGSYTTTTEESEIYVRSGVWGTAQTYIDGVDIYYEDAPTPTPTQTPTPTATPTLTPIPPPLSGTSVSGVSIN